MPKDIIHNNFYYNGLSTQENTNIPHPTLTHISLDQSAGWDLSKCNVLRPISGLKKLLIIALLEFYISVFTINCVVGKVTGSITTFSFCRVFYWTIGPVPVSTIFANILYPLRLQPIYE